MFIPILANTFYITIFILFNHELMNSATKMLLMNE